MKLKIYLDTSVFSLATDDRSPERRDLTLDFFQRSKSHELFTSEVAQREIQDTRDPERRAEIARQLGGFQILPVTSEMISLARSLIDEGVFTRAMEDDALHVAAAIHSGADILVSWNFQHLVNRRRRAHINSLFTAQGLPTIEIISPPEV